MHKISATNEYRQTLRKKILEESSEQFRKHGIKAIKMDDIATTLSISKRTLYELFNDKECLIMETAKMHMEKKQNKMEKFLERGPNVMEIILEIFKTQVEEISNVNPLMYSEMHKYKKVVDYLQKHKRHNRDSALEFFRKGVEEGFFRDDVRYDILCELADVQMEYVMSKMLYMRYPFIDIFKNLLVVNVRGFATVKGQKILDDFLNKLGK